MKVQIKRAGGIFELSIESETEAEGIAIDAFYSGYQSKDRQPLLCFDSNAHMRTTGKD